MTEWKIVIDPRAKDSPHESITVTYLPDKESAEIDAEGYAELIELHGGIASWAIDVATGNFLPAGVVRRVGKATWLIRTDQFEFERGDEGYDNGYGYLRVREVYG